MKQTVRSFSVGLMAATLILSIFYWMEPDEVSSDVSQLSEKDMFQKLEDKGYNILTDEQLESMAAPKATSNNEENTPTNQSNHEPKSITLEIESGMSSTDISEILYEQEMIEDAKAFDQYIREEGHSRYIQIGEFEVNEKMSKQQMADVITSN
ncbi:hypothetical protein MUO14_01715 [Halobacillus shinanisalinarum]|uniref:YceG-like family protein n=1 Tax=Halobacillus shinanisalinarum TaxID=2932258 RepID=A0ABY4H433_9BACI|nr:endolytic transglycosylase MltG [Halobacillus shinanisalinarum]UOQ93742.1 hypothetical protein MUO14_01715 [Halobacillus shinanisalinarum]